MNIDNENISMSSAGLEILMTLTLDIKSLLIITIDLICCMVLARFTGSDVLPKDSYASVGKTSPSTNMMHF